MQQSRIDSLMESFCNIIIGLVVSTLANWIILPVVLGVTLTLGDNLLIGTFFTIISIIRSYTIRRMFNGRSIWEALKSWKPWGYNHPGDAHGRD